MLDEKYRRMTELAAENPCVKVVRKHSVETAKDFDDGHFDFVYIDDDHTYKAVKEGIEAWWPKVRPGGVMAGHNYCQYILPTGVEFGVIKAVNEFSEAEKVVVHVDKELFSSWYVKKENKK